MAPLSLSAKASTSRLTRLSGLSQGTKPSNFRILQPSKMLWFLVVLILTGVNPVVFISSDSDVVLNMAQRCIDVKKNILYFRPLDPNEKSFKREYHCWHSASYQSKKKKSSAWSVFCADSYFGIRSTPVDAVASVKDPGHSANGAASRLQLNTHALYACSFE